MSARRFAWFLLLPLLVGVGCSSRRADDGPRGGAPRPVPAPALVPREPSQPPQPVPPSHPARRGGNLVVEWPTTHAPSRGGRLRTHITGALNAQAMRYWAGPTSVPDWLPLTRGALELFLLDETPDGLFALYREPYDATPNGCALSGPRRDMNCGFAVALFAPDQTERWALRLNDFFSRPDHLEVQDVRYSGGVVYFNEACQSYSREAQGRCSALVALDPATRRVRFRTRSLVSNGELAMLDAYVVTAYGFTAERDVLSLVSRSTGEVAARLNLPIAPDRIAVVVASPTRAVVELELTERSHSWLVLVEALDEPHPRFVPETPPPAQMPSRFPTLRMGMRDPAPTPAR